MNAIADTNTVSVIFFIIVSFYIIFQFAYKFPPVFEPNFKCNNFSYIVVIHSFDLTNASVHDLHYLNDVNIGMEDSIIIGDKAYLSKEVQFDLFTTSNIVLEIPMRVNQKKYKPQFPVFKKIRKRIETVFSQLDGQFMLGHNYAKDIDGLFTRVLAKISALTVLQYINKFGLTQPIGRVKHTLAA